MDNSSSNSSGSDEQRVVPSVSRDKLLLHARGKLSRGYVLIVGSQRRMASFFKLGVGYEPCQLQVAKLLVSQGFVQEAGPHFMGTMYRLSDSPPPPPPPPVDDDDEDDDEGDGRKQTAAMEALLEDIEDDGDAEESDDEEAEAPEEEQDDEDAF